VATRSNQLTRGSALLSLWADLVLEGNSTVQKASCVLLRPEQLLSKQFVSLRLSQKCIYSEQVVCRTPFELEDGWLYERLIFNFAMLALDLAYLPLWTLSCLLRGLPLQVVPLHNVAETLDPFLGSYFDLIYLFITINKLTLLK
jgi:hypothetical protein